MLWRLRSKRPRIEQLTLDCARVSGLLLQSRTRFDQNRAFLGLAVYAFEGLFRIEVGYLNVFLSREPNRLAHVLSLNFFVSHGGRSR
jgi:hypothetical protein